MSSQLERRGGWEEDGRVQARTRTYRFAEHIGAQLQSVRTERSRRWKRSCRPERRSRKGRWRVRTDLQGPMREARATHSVRVHVPSSDGLHASHARPNGSIQLVDPEMIHQQELRSDLVCSGRKDARRRSVPISHCSTSFPFPLFPFTLSPIGLTISKIDTTGNLVPHLSPSPSTPFPLGISSPGPVLP